jgi:hypothetical protein
MKKFIFILTLLYTLTSSNYIFAAKKKKITAPPPPTSKITTTTTITIPVSIIGLVEATDYDENDNPIELRLISEIDVNKNEAGKSLAKYIDKYVKVTGTVTISKDNSQEITISRVTPIDDNEPFKADDMKQTSTETQNSEEETY